MQWKCASIIRLFRSYKLYPFDFQAICLKAAPYCSFDSGSERTPFPCLSRPVLAANQKHLSIDSISSDQITGSYEAPIYRSIPHVLVVLSFAQSCSKASSLAGSTSRACYQACSPMSFLPWVYLDNRLVSSRCG